MSERERGGGERDRESVCERGCVISDGEAALVLAFANATTADQVILNPERELLSSKKGTPGKVLTTFT